MSGTEHTSSGAGDAEPYWFDIAPLTEEPDKVADEPDSARNRFRDQWRRGDSLKERLDAVLSADVKGMAADWWTDFGSGGYPLERFAAANGLRYQHQQYDGQPRGSNEDLDGMIFGRGERRGALMWGDPAAVEIGNWSSVGQELQLSFGYIAIRHGLDLPHLIVDARVNDARPPRGSWIYAKKTDFTSLSQNYRGSDSASPMSRVRHRVEPLDLGAELGREFQAYGAVGQTAQTLAFLTPERLQLMRAGATEFDLEITNEWVYLYANEIDMSTPKPERLAWVFSVTSRVLDHVSLWRQEAGLPPAELPPFYTKRIVPRPDDLARLPKPSPGWNAFWDLQDPHK